MSRCDRCEGAAFFFIAPLRSPGGHAIGGGENLCPDCVVVSARREVEALEAYQAQAGAGPFSSSLAPAAPSAARQDRAGKPLPAAGSAAAPSVPFCALVGTVVQVRCVACATWIEVERGVPPFCAPCALAAVTAALRAAGERKANEEPRAPENRHPSSALDRASRLVDRF